jgi:hypothetical protein
MKNTYCKATVDSLDLSIRNGVESPTATKHTQELLAALKCAESIIENFTLGAQGDDDPDFSGEFAALAQIREAIARAEGNQ